jgi:penicillin amidase
MEQDTVSLPARDFVEIVKEWHPIERSAAAKVRSELLAWDCNVTMDSRPALFFEVWIEHIHRAMLPTGIASTRLSAEILMRELKTSHDRNDILARTLNATLVDVRKRLGSNESEWKWGNLHKAHFRHPLHAPTLDLPPHARPGDAYTVNATGGLGYMQTHGASYREIIDVSNWDRSMMTNVPGESGVPGDRHYGDLIDGWADGRYHPMPYSRKAVEAVAEECILLLPDNR